MKSQEIALRLGPDVVIATPGRLIDHLHNAPAFNLANVEVLVLDEADRLVLNSYFCSQCVQVRILCYFQNVGRILRGTDERGYQTLRYNQTDHVVFSNNDGRSML